MGNIVSCTSSSAVPRVSAVKRNSYNIRVKDGGTCGVTGMAIANDKRKLLVDSCNDKVKLFSTDMEFLSSVALPDSPLHSHDISVVNNETAIVTSYNNTLVILDISGRQLSISRTVKLDYVHRIGNIQL